MAIVFILAVFAAVSVADLTISTPKRRSLAAALPKSWAHLQSMPWLQLLGNAASAFPSMPSHRDSGWLFKLATGLMVVAAATAATLTFASLVLDKPAMVSINHFLQFFAGPGILSAAIAIAFTNIALSRIRHTTGLTQQLIWVGLMLSAIAMLWLGLMHAGTWLEWRVKASPTAYGSEWFYAEAYLEYVREPVGQAVSLACITIVVLPMIPFLVSILAKSMLKVLRAALAPMTIYLAGAFARTPRGRLCAIAGVICLGLWWLNTP